MGLCSSSRCGRSVRFRVKLVVGTLLVLCASALCYAQDIPIGAHPRGPLPAQASRPLEEAITARL